MYLLRGRLLGSLPVLAGLLMALGTTPEALAQAKTATRVKAVEQVKVSAQEITANRTFGSKSAPITIDEFSDFQCPACRQLYLQTIRPLIDDYVASGKVYLVHHDFPLNAHKYARDAARYADAAAAIGKFERVEEALFNKQAEWSANGKVDAAVASVLTPVEMKRVQQLLHDNLIEQVIERDVSLGNQLQVRQTPTMYITRNGQRTPVVGVVTYQILRMYLDDQLRQ